MKVCELLDKPEKLTRSAFARCSNGMSCGANDEEASCWCLDGAIQKCYTTFNERWKVAKTISDKIIELFPQYKSCFLLSERIYNFNDNECWDRIKKLIDEVNL